MTEEEVNAVLVEMRLKGYEVYEGGTLIMYRTDLYSSLAEAEKAGGAVYSYDCESVSSLWDADDHASLIQSLYGGKLPVRKFLLNGDYTLPLDIAQELMTGLVFADSKSGQTGGELL